MRNEEQRYRVRRLKGRWFKRYGVFAGTGTMEVFRGSKLACLRVASCLTTAYRDGYFIAEQNEKGRIRKDVMENILSFDTFDNSEACIVALRIAEKVRNGMLTERPAYYSE